MISSTRRPQFPSSCVRLHSAPQAMDRWPALLLLAALAFASVQTGGDCLRNVKLTIQPAVVERGQSVRLLCDFDLEGGRLKAVRWYRYDYYNHQREAFFSYQPPVKNGLPHTEVSPIKKGTPAIDLAHSNATQVTVTKVSHELNGELICEVTTDNPGKQIQHSIADLTVVAVPRHEPKVRTDKKSYQIGEMMLANCTAPPSWPQSELFVTFNNRTLKPELFVTPHYHMFASTEKGSQLNVSVFLQQDDFQDGRLILECIAPLPGNFTKKSLPLELVLLPSKPVPERVTPSSAWLVQPHAALLLGALALLIR